MVQMNIAEAKAKLSELVARAQAGEEVIIARDGKAVIALTPLPAPGALRVGLLGQVDESWDPRNALDEDA